MSLPLLKYGKLMPDALLELRGQSCFYFQNARKAQLADNLMQGVMAIAYSLGSWERHDPSG